ncbi:MAG TPA: protoporphyrinogen oxidase [Vicinamibacterales bacterium]|nr:protoporphyrinogen oxidase [Vicinamibacterales bacterium]
MTTPRVVVIGGGITGLSLAFTLQESARRLGAPLALTVVDAAPRVGGHAWTTRANGFLIEAGPNGFLNREPHTLALVEALELGARLVEARPEAKRRFIVRDGRLCQVPDGPATLLTTPALSWRGKLRLMGEPFAAGPPAGVEETIHAFATRRIGAEAAEMLVDAAVSGISAGDSRRLSVGAQFPLMTDMERDHGSLVRAMFARRRQGTGPSKLLSFDQGMGTLVGALADRLGNAVQPDSPVLAIERTGDTWRVTMSGSRTLEADHVVVAASARAAAPMVGVLDGRLAAALDRFEYAGLTVVALGYRATDLPRALDGYGYLVTRPEGLASLGVVWESSLFPGRAPEGAALLRVMMGGSRRPEVVKASDEQKVTLAQAELARVMGIEAMPRHVSVFTWPGAIAQYTVGHFQRRADVMDRLGRHPGLWMCGTSYDGVSFNHAVKSGRLTAHRLADRLWGDRRPVDGATGVESASDRWEIGTSGRNGAPGRPARSNPPSPRAAAGA